MRSAFLLACGLGMVACGSDGGDTTPQTITIAIELPLGGGESASSVPIENGIKLAVKEAGAVAGYDIKVVTYDDSVNGVHDADKGAENMHAIVADSSVVAVIGPLNSGVAIEQIPISNAAGLFQCSPSNTNPQLTKPDFGAGDLRTKPNNYVRVATTDDLQGPAAASYMFQKLHVTSVYVADDTEDFGSFIADAFSAQFTAEGGTVVGRDSIAQEGSDYDALLTAAAEKNPGGVYFGGVSFTGGAAVVNAARAAGLTVPFMSGDGIFDGPGDVEGSFINLAGASATPSYATLAAIGDYPQQAAFTTRYHAEYGEDPSGYAPAGYACAQVVLDALARAAATNPADLAALRAAVRTAGVDTTHAYSTVLGTNTFDANGDTSQKIISIYEVDPAAAGGEGDWVYKEQIDFGATP